eukprot:5549384-Prorocentrum_lima.AAC.1
MTSSLVGSEMCIRDRVSCDSSGQFATPFWNEIQVALHSILLLVGVHPVSYTHLTLPTICSV